MSKAKGRTHSKKKIIRNLIIFIIVFIVVNLIGAAVGTSTSITHPAVPSYDKEIQSIKDRGMWGDFDSYTQNKYEVAGRGGYILHCMLVTNDNSLNTGKYVIISHGHRSNMYGDVKYTGAYLDLGYNCIIYDCRDHGANEQTICSMGGYEAEDLNMIIEDAYGRYSDIRILGLQGESMGSTSSMSVLKYNNKVDFIVADCGYSSLKYMVHDMYNDMYLYPFGTCADIGFKLLYGIDTAAVSAIDSIKGKDVPILFVHGGDDTFIDVDNSKIMYEICSESAYSELWIVEGAGHADSMEIAGKKAYEEHIASFLDKAQIDKE